ncbi:hypothetical protein P171DRAFT_97796 [Karstenula rhodostoma CBS 690.94]|uniref:Uncharacterized protein n=1 Tax=Karstenula rhodostoma CBS 690.94 TaxID=1392251 RepID=A0A9P4PA25_9PLEO|nr:hypothetical protein P171DRAFT_97796 [Karstenula rhodostoma CBS 690.94]
MNFVRILRSSVQLGRGRRWWTATVRATPHLHLHPVLWLWLCPLPSIIQTHPRRTRPFHISLARPLDRPLFPHQVRSARVLGWGGKRQRRVCADVVVRALQFRKRRRGGRSACVGWGVMSRDVEGSPHRVSWHGRWRGGGLGCWRNPW